MAFNIDSCPAAPEHACPEKYALQSSLLARRALSSLRKLRDHFDRELEAVKPGNTDSRERGMWRDAPIVGHDLPGFGAAYYERLLIDMDDAEVSLSGAAASPSGRLRIDVPSPLARMLLIPAFPAFHARYPDLQIEMGVSDRMVDLIGDNVDCVIRGGELTEQSLIARHVGDLRLGVYAAPSYLQRVGTPLHPADLEQAQHRTVGFLSSRTGKVLSYPLRRGGESIEVQGRHILAVDDGNAYLAAGLAGMGVLWLPDYMAKPHLERGELVPLFEGWELDSMPLYLAFPPNRHVSVKLRVFINLVVEVMAQHAPIADRTDRGPDQPK